MTRRGVGLYTMANDRLRCRQHRGGRRAIKSESRAVVLLLLGAHVLVLVCSCGGSPTAPTSAAATQGCGYSVSPARQDVSSLGGSSFSATVTQSSGSCSWSASTTVSWLKVTGPVTGSGTTTLAYSVDANSGPGRSAVITVTWSGGSAALNVNQAAGTSSGSPSPPGA